MPDAKQVLKSFGLTENEAETYLLLLKMGSAQPSEIAQKTNIHRINVYDILERLQEKGLVSFAVVGKRKQYESINPKKILEIEKEREKEIELIIPELIKQRGLGKEPQEATIFKDKKGIKNILEDVSKSKTNVYLFASGWGFSKNFPEYANVWYAHLKMNKVKLKTLVSSKFKGANLPKFGEYRFLPSEFIFPSTTCVYEDKVVIIMWSEQPITVLIKGRHISDSYKEFFGILWKSSKKV